MAKLVNLILAFWATLFVSPLFAHESLEHQIERANRTLATHPKDTEELFNRAMLHFQRQQYQGALEDLKVLETLGEMPSEALLLKARVLMKQKTYKQAFSTLEGLLSREPKSTDGYLLRSQLNHQVNRGTEAVADARKAIDYAPFPLLLHYRHFIAMERQYGTTESTAEAFELTIARVGSSSALLNLYAQWLASIGRLDQAASVYAQLRDEIPTLSFTTWLAEVEMWRRAMRPHRANAAMQHAKDVWQTLSPNIRRRQAMVERYERLVSQMQEVEGGTL